MFEESEVQIATKTVLQSLVVPKMYGMEYRPIGR